MSKIDKQGIAVHQIFSVAYKGGDLLRSKCLVNGFIKWGHPELCWMPGQETNGEIKVQCVVTEVASITAPQQPFLLQNTFI